MNTKHLIGLVIASCIVIGIVWLVLGDHSSAPEIGDADQPAADQPAVEELAPTGQKEERLPADDETATSDKIDAESPTQPSLFTVSESWTV